MPCLCQLWGCTGWGALGLLREPKPRRLKGQLSENAREQLVLPPQGTNHRGLRPPFLTPASEGSECREACWWGGPTAFNTRWGSPDPRAGGAAPGPAPSLP